MKPRKYVGEQREKKLVKKLRKSEIGKKRQLQ
jgi:hypothetical protein